MTIKKRGVSVLQVPNQISSNAQEELLRRLEMSAENGHPRFVLDCSKVEVMGSREIHFLLNCLEEVMKHNGDVRLAELDPQSQAVVRTTGLGRVFEMYETIEGAIHSFQVRPASMAPLYSEVAELNQENEYAA